VATSLLTPRSQPSETEPVSQSQPFVCTTIPARWRELDTHGGGRVFAAAQCFTTVRLDQPARRCRPSHILSGLRGQRLFLHCCPAFLRKCPPYYQPDPFPQYMWPATPTLPSTRTCQDSPAFPTLTSVIFPNFPPYTCPSGTSQILPTFLPSWSSSFYTLFECP